MPPHRGHLCLIDFARHYADTLTIVVGSLAEEPIPGELRFRWMKELFPSVEVVHLTDENPQYPEEHPEFWQIWRESLERICPRKIDCLFASEDYGQKLADSLGAVFVPNINMRNSLPISATEIRNAPFEHWTEIPHLVRPYFTKRVLVFGPESTGKTTLCKKLAHHYQGAWVPEYARTWLQDRTESEITLSDMEIIARGQMAGEAALARSGYPWLFCDTDVLTTKIWCEELFAEVPGSVRKLASQGQYDLTLLLQVDVPWQAGPLRLRPGDRQRFFDRCRRALEEEGRPYDVISGKWDSRFQQACGAIDRLTKKRAP